MTPTADLMKQPFYNGTIEDFLRDHGICADDRKALVAALTASCDARVGGEVAWAADLAALKEVMAEASAVPLQWQASTDFTPEQAKEWLATAVSENVRHGDFTGELHSIAELESGLTVAFTGCGPKSAANAKFLVWCAHFVMKHMDALATPAQPKASEPKPPDGGLDPILCDFHGTNDREELAAAHRAFIYGDRDHPNAPTYDDFVRLAKDRNRPKASEGRAVDDMARAVKWLRKAAHELHTDPGDTCSPKADHALAYALDAAADTLATPAQPKASEPVPNRQIAELLAEYDMGDWTQDEAAKAARRYVSTMPDSQVRCLLHILAQPSDPKASEGKAGGEDAK